MVVLVTGSSGTVGRAVAAAICTTARLGLAAGLTDDVRTVTGRAPATERQTLTRERGVGTHPRRSVVEVAVLGGTGRTGRAVVAELLRRGHDVAVLARDPATLGDAAASVRVVRGDSRDAGALTELTAGVDAVVSALGPVGREPTLHRDTAAALVPVLQQAGVTRFVGVSGAGIDVPGDRKSRRDRLISALVQRLGGAVVADKPAEHAVFAASDLDWTLVRPPRLTDGPATGRVEHHASESCRGTRIGRADLAAFLVDCVEQHLYPRRAPLVAAAR
ncbi:NAD(P)-dependent oxidoreductase [Geodermatophilus marinus]|uniref:NAD(P)-dependent oxidoreductase n=1 Tax=Geodermatophilus sp. LHW52908 TaxID=2303986 RepID=UPI001314EA91|nr:NAD(P)H-binding protein [Geodermatophilus sp. LHW52908]